MTRTCRKWKESWWRKQQITRAALRHARIVTDPNLLAHLNAEVEKRKRSIVPAPPSHFRDR